MGDLTGRGYGAVKLLSVQLFAVLSWRIMDLSALTKAVQSLERALIPPPANDRERDGAIQRFEYTLELCWKTGQKILKSQGITSNSPKMVFRDLGQLGMLDSPQAWIDFVDCRNETSHTYKDEIAEKVFACVGPFLVAATELLRRFEAHGTSNP